MLKTFIGKFTFFFWLSFFMVNIPIYLFGISYIKDVMKTSEHEKISLMFSTLKPIVALSLSFEQNKQLFSTFESVLEYEYIHYIELKIPNKEVQEFSSHASHKNEELFSFKSEIFDPFENKKIADITIHYSNLYLENVNNELLFIFFFLFLLASVLFFFLFIFFIRKDTLALKSLAHTLKDYLNSKKFQEIEVYTHSQEIETIIHALNDVGKKNAEYVEELQVFNTQLENKVLTKVADLKEKEELMVHQSRQAAMGEMLESIAHQWRQPLNIIGLATTKLDLAYKLNTMDASVLPQTLETISFNINFMSNTIDDFRNFIHPNQRTTDFKPKKCFEDILNILGAQLKNNSILYTLHVKDDPQFFGVENEFVQVALILLNNSIDAIKTHRVTTKNEESFIDVHISKSQNTGLIQVTDNGGGINKKIIHSIFNPYFSTKFASQGTGIGLHIVKNIIESRMKGSISVENTQRGCVFSIEIPLHSLEKEVR